MRWPGACAIGLATLAVAPLAAADDATEPIVLAWSAPHRCPTEQDVRAEIERALGGPPDPATRRYLRAEAHVTQVGAGFHLHLVTDLGGVVGERDLDGPTCAAVARAAAVIVALTFDPEAVARRASAAGGAPKPATPAPPPGDGHAAIAPDGAPKAGEPRPPTPPLPVPAPAPPPPPSPAPPPPRPRADRSASPMATAPRARPDFALGAFAGASLGDLPNVGASFGGRASVLVGRFRVELGGSYAPYRTATLDEASTAGGRIRLAAGDARGCFAILRAPVELAPCLGLELGSMAATGFGARSNGSGGTLWVAPLVEARIAVPVGRHFAPWLGLEALVPALRPPFVIEGAGTVYTAGPVVGRARIGLEARF